VWRATARASPLSKFGLARGDRYLGLVAERRGYAGCANERLKAAESGKKGELIPRNESCTRPRHATSVHHGRPYHGRTRAGPGPRSSGSATQVVARAVWSA